MENNYMNPVNWGKEEWKGAAEAFACCAAVMITGFGVLWLASFMVN